MVKNNSIKKNALINGLRTILNIIFPIITFPYISRVLSVDEIGKYNFSSSIVTYFLLIAALGIDKYAIREGAALRGDRERISKFASEIFTINFISTVISYLFLFCYLLLSAKAYNYRHCILIFSLQILFTTLGMDWLYSIYEEYQYITIKSIIFKVLSIVLLFILVKNKGDYLIYAGINVFAVVGSNIINFIHSRKLCDIKLTFKFNWGKRLTPIMLIFASNIAIQIYVNSDTTMLGYIKGDYYVGIYSVAVKIYTLAKLLLSSVVVVSVPRLALLAGKGDEDSYSELLSKVLNALLLMSIPFVVGIFMISKNIVLIIAGEKYLQSVTSLRILSLAIFFSIFSTLFNQCVLLPYKRDKKSLFNTMFNALLNVALNLVFIPIYAEKGAAFTTLIAEFGMAILNLYFGKDVLSKILVHKKTIKNLISIIVGSMSIIFLCCFIGTLKLNMMMETVGSVITSMMIYAIILLVFRNDYVGDILIPIKEKIIKLSNK